MYTILTESQREEKVLRIRHYKQTETQEYMQRKRQQRYKEEQEQKLVNRQRAEKKQQNLANLVKKARKNINVAPHRPAKNDKKV